jgi:hypothetical protein
MINLIVIFAASSKKHQFPIMIRTRKIKHFLILLSLPFMLTLYYNQVTNWHLHVNDSGMVVKHAHPYQSNTIPGTPFQKHHHSHLEFSILALLFSSVTILGLLLVLGLLTEKTLYNRTVQPECRIIGNYRLSNNPLRGPPFSC